MENKEITGLSTTSSETVKMCFDEQNVVISIAQDRLYALITACMSDGVYRDEERRIVMDYHSLSKR